MSLPVKRAVDKACRALLFIVPLAVLVACAQSTSVVNPVNNGATWQEQYDLGMRYLAEGNYSDAVIAFTLAIKIDPKQALAYVGRGDAYVGMMSISETPQEITRDECYQLAEKDYLTVTELERKLIDVYTKLLELYREMDADDKVDALWHKEYDAGVQWLNQGIPEESVFAFNLVVMIDPTHPEGYWGLADAFIAQGDYEKARKTIEDGIAVCGDADLFKKYLNNLEFATSNDIGVKITNIYFNHESYIKGEETAFYAQVIYRCSEDSGNYLMIGANTNELESFKMTETVSPVQKAGTAMLEIVTMPTHWDNKVFGIRVELHDYTNGASVEAVERDEFYLDEQGKYAGTMLGAEFSPLLTVAGTVFDNRSVDEYAKKWQTYSDEYGPYDAGDGRLLGRVGITGNGIRFSPPIEIIINGKSVSIAEAELVWRGHTGLGATLGEQTLTGRFRYDEDYQELTENPSHPDQSVTHYEYDPNGPFDFVVDSD